MISDESNATPEPETPRARRKSAKKPKPAKKPVAAKPAKPKSERASKKAEAIALMERQRRNTGRDHEGHGLLLPRMLTKPQGRREDRVV